MQIKDDSKPVCPKCGSDDVETNYSSQNDHHQVDFMTEYIDYTCNVCGHKWEKSK